MIISPDDAEPVEFSHPALFMPTRRRSQPAPTKAEALVREAIEAAKLTDEAKKVAAKAPREMTLLNSSLRKKSAEAELAAADKALARAEQAKVRAEDRKQKAIGGW